MSKEPPSITLPLSRPAAEAWFPLGIGKSVHQIISHDPSEVSKCILSSLDIENLHKSERVDSFVHLCLVAAKGPYRLVIRPDDIWAAIQSQFMIYLNKHSEELIQDGKLRKPAKPLRISKKKKKKQQVLIADQIISIATERYGDELMNWILPKFTTSSDSDQIIFALFCDSQNDQTEVKQGLLKIKGLSEIMLLGSLEDWRCIRTRIDKLLEFEISLERMSKWYTMLTPVLDQMIESVQGKANLTWWKKMFFTEERSRVVLSGWLTVFNVFDNHGRWIGECRPGKPFPEIEPAVLASGRMVLKNALYGRTSVILTTGLLVADVENLNQFVPRMGYVMYEAKKPSLWRRVKKLLIKGIGSQQQS